MADRILITGATGLVGKTLTKNLLAKGYQINILSRKKQSIPNVRVFVWDVDAKFIELEAFNGVSTIIHLAGEGIAEKRWTKKRKMELIGSRVETADLLFQTIKSHKFPIKSFISASAVGYYGNRGDELLREQSFSGDDFLAECCIKWEKAAQQFESLNIRVACVRIGVILSKDGGALASLEKPIKYFLGAVLGNGKQWVPWVHIDDVVGIFIYLTEHETLSGAYNACSPEPVTNKILTKAVAGLLHRPVWPFAVPAVVLKLALGEMAAVILNSTNTSAEKILRANYSFKHINLAEALKNIYGN